MPLTRGEFHRAARGNLASRVFPFGELEDCAVNLHQRPLIAPRAEGKIDTKDV
jgi:hypothetical protein